MHPVRSGEQRGERIGCDAATTGRARRLHRPADDDGADAVVGDRHSVVGAERGDDDVAAAPIGPGSPEPGAEHRPPAVEDGGYIGQPDVVLVGDTVRGLQQVGQQVGDEGAGGDGDRTHLSEQGVGGRAIDCCDLGQQDPVVIARCPTARDHRSVAFGHPRRRRVGAEQPPPLHGRPRHRHVDRRLRRVLQSVERHDVGGNGRSHDDAAARDRQLTGRAAPAGCR